MMEPTVAPLELLAPAGDIERLQAAVRYGADAVYLAGKEFGMRAGAPNFDEAQLVEAIDYAHKNGVKVYITCNTLQRNEEVERFPAFIRSVTEAGADACIVNDIGLFSLFRQYAPEMPLHVSTQAGIVNYQTALAFYQMGARRAVLARELTLSEIAQIRRRVPMDMELEAFVHGAMCMSISGRCLLSNYLTGRDANRGECAQPCRWNYRLVEEKRPGQYFPIVEEENGSYILNAKDLCMIEYLPQLAQAGVTSLKIEGRAKSAYYVSVVTNAYRCAIDQYQKDRQHFVLEPWLLEEVKKVSHRRYSTGFYLGDIPTQYHDNGGYLREYDVVAVIERCEGGFLHCTQKNKFSAGDTVEVLPPGQRPISLTVEQLWDEDGTPLESVCHAHMPFKLASHLQVPCGTIIRKQK